MYARGMSVRCIRGHLEELCGLDVSPGCRLSHLGTVGVQIAVGHSGQDSSVDRPREMYSCNVVRPMDRLAAISRVECPCAASRKTSLIFRISNLVIWLPPGQKTGRVDRCRSPHSSWPRVGRMPRSPRAGQIGTCGRIRSESMGGCARHAHSGGLNLAMAPLSASTQKSASSVFEMRQANTLRVCQSTIATTPPHRQICDVSRQT